MDKACAVGRTDSIPNIPLTYTKWMIGSANPMIRTEIGIMITIMYRASLYRRSRKSLEESRVDEFVGANFDNVGSEAIDTAATIRPKGSCCSRVA